MQYRREIDGLRAIAVVPVILFHAEVPGWAGGFLGVDVFFVISGYLITAILLADIGAERFSLWRFYERRARRILPALFVVLTACLPAAWIWMPPEMLAEFGESLTATAFFLANLHFAKETGYFATEAEILPLLHTWSLAVEEQYYLVFPLVLLWLARRGVVLAGLAALALASLSLAEWGARSAGQEMFFFTPARVWELLAGALCAAAEHRRGAPMSARPGWVRQMLAMVSLTAVIAALVEFDTSVPTPSLWTVWPVAGVAGLLLFARSGTLAASALSLRPLVAVGLVSYSAYLWHQPLFAFARMRSAVPPDAIETAVLVGLTFGLAALSWWLVEQPARRAAPGLLVRRGVLLGAAAAGSLAFVALGALIDAGGGAPGRFDGVRARGAEPDNKVLAQQSWEALRARTGDTRYGVDDNPADLQAWFTPRDARPLLVVGNSHSKDVYNILRASRGVTTTHQLARFGVQIADLADPAHVFWNSPNLALAEVVVIATRYIDRHCEVPGAPCRDDLAALPEVLGRLVSEGKTVLVVGNAPEFPHNGAWTMADLALLGDGVDPEALSLRARDLMDRAPRVAGINAGLETLAQRHGATYADRVALHCGTRWQGCVQLTPSGQKVMYDGHHVTQAGAALLGRRIDETGWFPLF